MAHGVKTLDLMIALFGRWSCRNGCGNSEMVREPGSFLVVADSVQLHGEQVLAQDYVVNALAALEGDVRGDDGHAGWEGFHELRPEVAGSAGSRADYLIEVPHHYQSLCRQLAQYSGQAVEVVFVVIPPGLAFHSSTGFGPATKPWNGNCSDLMR